MEVLIKISKENLLSYQRRPPKLSDLELVSLNITAEYMGIDSENNLFRLLPESILSKIERSVYNRRRRKLVNLIDKIRLELASHFNEFEDYFIVDSMPLEVCKLSRSSRSYVKKHIIVCQTKAIVLRKVLIIMDINYTPYVLLMVFIKVLIYLRHLYTM